MAPHNQTKHSGVTSRNAKHVTGGYGYARYGMSFYGSTGLRATNLMKTGGQYLWASATHPWLLALPWAMTGSGLTFGNISKHNVT